MAQYTSSSTSATGGFTATAVLNSVTNTITIIGTNANGVIVGETEISVNDAVPGSLAIITTVGDIRGQWQAKNDPLLTAAELGAGIRNAIQTAIANVLAQMKTAEATATVTGETVPDQIAATPILPNSDPAVKTVDTPGQENTQTSAPIVNPPTIQSEPFTPVNVTLTGAPIVNPPTIQEEPFVPVAIPVTIPTVVNLPATNPDTFVPVQVPLATPPTANTYATLDVSGSEGSPPGNMLSGPPTGNTYATLNVSGSEDTSTVQPATDPGATGPARGLSGEVTATRASSTLADEAELDSTSDWRVKLSLAPDATYLYKSTTPGILQPLYDTDGVVFPYTPQVSVAYSSNYEPTDIVHSNYKIFNYKNSSVDNVSLTCDFTAQDTYEANYLLAVIHFFRSVTKMFYGKDTSPKNGTPPPLCYLYGLGEYQFNAHPLLISSFTYNLPNDVDYIRAGGVSSPSASATPPTPSRLGSTISPGGTPTPVKWGSPANNITTPTYVPTKMQITILAHPIITRAAISNRFSLKDYASGSLLRGSTRPTTSYGGIW